MSVANVALDGVMATTFDILYHFNDDMSLNSCNIKLNLILLSPNFKARISNKIQITK